MFNDFNLPLAGNVARKKSAAIVFLEADSGEGYITVDGNEGDRNNLTAWHGGDALVLSVAAQNNNTIVIINSVGPLILEPWIDHPNVTAVGPYYSSHFHFVLNILLLGCMGWPPRARNWQRPCRCIVRCLEPIWTPALYHRKEPLRLQCPAYTPRRWTKPQ